MQSWLILAIVAIIAFATVECQWGGYGMRGYGGMGGYGRGYDTFQLMQRILLASLLVIIGLVFVTEAQFWGGGPMYGPYYRPPWARPPWARPMWGRPYGMYGPYGGGWGK
ncbi:unnamed protein product, partial [Mesorhabditis spiculigera]